MRINIGGLKQSAAAAHLGRGITKDDFRLVCACEKDAELFERSHDELFGIVGKINKWYFGY